MAEVQRLEYQVGLVASRFLQGVRHVTGGLQAIGQRAQQMSRIHAQATQRVQNGLRAVEQRITTVTQSAQRAQMVIASLSTALSLVAFRKAANDAAQYADQIKAVSEATGLTVRQVQQLSHAAKESFTDLQTLQSGLRALLRRSAEAASGNTQMAEGFRRLGVEVTDAHGNMRPIMDIFMDVAEATSHLNSEAEMAALLMRVMGDAGRRLVPMMRQGASGIRDLADQAERLGLIMEDRHIEQWAQVAGQIGLLRERSGALVRTWVSMYLPAVQRVTGAVERFVDWLQSLDDEQRQQIARWGLLIAAVLAGVAAFGLIGTVAGVVVKGLMLIGGAIAFITSPWLLLTALIIAGVGALYRAWDENLYGIRDITESVWGAIGDIWEKITNGFEVTWKWIAERTGEAWDWLSGPAWEWVRDNAWPTLKEKFTVTWSWIATRTGIAWGWLSGDAWTWIKDEAWPTLTESFSKTWQWTANRLGDAWGWLSGTAWTWVRDKAWPTLTDKVEVAWEWAADRAGEAWDWLSGDAWDWITDTAWPALTESAETAWKWAAEKGGDAWDWLSGPAWTWVKDTGWPTLTRSLSVAWAWAAERSGQAWGWLSGDAWEWVRDTGWPTLTQSMSAAWKWAADRTGDAWTWLSGPAWDWVKDTAWPAITTGFSVAWTWVAEKGGAAWDWVTDTLIPWVTGPLWEKLSTGFETAWEWTAALGGDVWQWLKEVAWPHINGVVETTWNWAIEIGGEIYQAIKKGLDTGDWSDLFVVGADVWRTGIKIAVTLSLAYGSVNALIQAIQTGLGTAAVGLSSIRALGVPGAIAAITIAVALAEAKATGGFQKFGEDLGWAIAAGLAVYGITRNPQLGAYTFTIFMSWELGSKAGEWLRGIVSRGETEPFQVSEEAAAKDLAGWREELEKANQDLRDFVSLWHDAVDELSEEEVIDLALWFGAKDLVDWRQRVLGYIQEHVMAELDQLAIESKLPANLRFEIPESMRASARLGDLASDAADMAQQVVDAIIRAYPYHERHRDVLMAIATGYRDVAEAIGAPLGIEELFEMMSLVLSESSVVLGNIEAMQNPARVTAAGFEELSRHGIELVHSTEGMLRNLEASLRLFRLYKAEFGAPDLAAGAYLFPGFARRGEWDRPFTGAADVRGMTAGEKARRFDEIYSSIIGAVGMEHGGIVPSGGPPGDWFPAVLASDEAVIPKRIWQGGLVAIGKWFRAQGVPGFQTGRAPDIAGLNAQIDEQRGLLGGLERTLGNLMQSFVGGMMTVIDLLATVLEAVGRAILGDEQFEAFQATIADARARVEEFIDSLIDAGEAAEDLADDLAAADPVKEQTRWERFHDWLRFRWDRTLGFFQGGWRDWLRDAWVQTSEDGTLTGGLKKDLADLGSSVVSLLNPLNLLAAIVDRLGFAAALLEGFFRPLGTLIERLQHPFKVLGEMLGMLFVPLIEALYPLLQGFAWVVSWVAEIIAHAWNALARTINAILGWLGVRLGLIDVDAIRQARGKLGEPPSADDPERRRASPAFAELAGPTRNLLVELLRPLTNLNVLQGIGERVSGYLADIKEMLAQGIRIQGLVMPDIQAAAVGAMESVALAVPGAGPWLSVEGDLNVHVDDPTDPNQILDAVSRMLGKQVRVQRRGKRGRDER